MRCFLIFSLLVPITCFAEFVTRTGEVEFVRSHSKSVVGDDVDWVAIKGVTSMGSCRVADGYVVLRIKDDMDRTYSTALAAQMAGKRVKINVDDNLKDSSGACWLRWLNVIN